MKNIKSKLSAVEYSVRKMGYPVAEDNHMAVGPR